MFVFKGTTHPIPATYVRSQWRAAIISIGQKPQAYTLHTLRKSAVTTAFDEGEGERQVQHFGGWASQAYKAYIHKKEDKRVAHLLANTLAPPRKSRKQKQS